MLRCSSLSICVGHRTFTQIIPDDWSYPINPKPTLVRIDGGESNPPTFSPLTFDFMANIKAYPTYLLVKCIYTCFYHVIPTLGGRFLKNRLSVCLVHKYIVEQCLCTEGIHMFIKRTNQVSFHGWNDGMKQRYFLC